MSLCPSLSPSLPLPPLPLPVPLPLFVSLPSRPTPNNSLPHAADIRPRNPYMVTCRRLILTLGADVAVVQKAGPQTMAGIRIDLTLGC